MIKVNELRIGNHVLDEHGNISIINTISRSVRISNDKYEWESKGEEQIHPIPLTDEHLLGSGFEKNGHYFSKNNVVIYKHHGKFNSDYFIFDCGITDELTEIKHLHELQNLYFSLTKTELKIENYEKTNTKT